MIKSINLVTVYPDYSRITPAGGATAQGYKYGALYNVKEIIRKFIESHPTETGWGWDRSCVAKEGEPKWIPMSEDEVFVLKKVEEVLRNMM